MKKNILLIAALAFAATILVSSCKKPIGKCDEFFEHYSGICSSLWV